MTKLYAVIYDLPKFVRGGRWNPHKEHTARREATRHAAQSTWSEHVVLQDGGIVWRKRKALSTGLACGRKTGWGDFEGRDYGTARNKKERRSALWFRIVHLSMSISNND